MKTSIICLDQRPGLTLRPWLVKVNQKSLNVLAKSNRDALKLALQAKPLTLSEFRGDFHAWA